MPAAHWVVGAGGLLGSAVTRALTERGGNVLDRQATPWGTDGESAALAASLRELISLAAGGAWTVYWCAGAGVTDTQPEVLARERDTFIGLLDVIAGLPSSTRANGAVFLASSAGAIYGGSLDAPFSESSQTAPLGEYGRAKLAAEQALEEFSATAGIPTLVGRISNLYGPGQRLAKRQGLISRLCYSAVAREPISIFVPLDTLRDYIFVDDCARLVVDGALRLHGKESPRGHWMKILASGRSTSVAALLGAFRRSNLPRPLVVMGSSAAASLQGRDIRLRSTVWPDLDLRPTVTLPDGIARTMRSIHHAIVAGDAS